MQKMRIGIYAGTFDPVHAGHIAFALQALADAQLDEVYFMPERAPRGKPGVEHFGHRVAMLRRALRPHDSLAVLELVDKQFSVARTWPQLQRLFPDCELVLLMGADVFVRLPQWPHATQLARSCRFTVAVRDSDELKAVALSAGALHLPAGVYQIVETSYPEVSSTRIRHALGRDKPARGLLPSVRRYARKAWLYAAIR